MTENEFTKFFTTSNTRPSPNRNIVNDIKNRLDKVDLQEIYGEASIKSVFERFKRDETIKTVVEKDFLEELDIEKINGIDALTLNPNFRKYPDSRREFKFSKVNIISGTNCAGKTSLLEGIELVVAGKTLRNPDVKEPDGCVEAVINASRCYLLYLGQALLQEGSFHPQSHFEKADLGDKTCGVII